MATKLHIDKPKCSHRGLLKAIPLKTQVAATCFLIPNLSAQTVSSSAETWILNHLKGHQAMADTGYKFIPSGLSNPIILTFDGESGSVSGSDLKFVRLGKSTLIGLATNKDMETVEIYQIDRINNKILFCKSRIGTKAILELLSDTTMSFIGDAKRVSK